MLCHYIKCATLLLITRLFIPNFVFANETKISLFTEDNQPPFNMLVNEKISGLATELIEELFKREKIPYSIGMLP